MYYLEKNCSVCGDGILGFLRCSDGRTIVVMCEECSSVWLTSDEVEDKYPLYPEAPRFFYSLTLMFLLVEVIPDGLLLKRSVQPEWETMQTREEVTIYNRNVEESCGY